MTRHPNLFIIGAAKCGTTSAYEWLKGHPQVFMSPAKEPRYFAPDLHSGSQHDLLHPHDGDRYLALFADAGDEKWLGEASVRYINSKQAPRLIHEFAPEARIVAMIRNPVDMLHSLHNQRVSEGSEPLVDFAAALAADDDRAAGRRLPPGRSAARAVYRPRARFAELLTPWIELFGRDAVHVIVFEDLVDDPAAVLRRLLGFLEIDADYQPGSYAARNRSHAPRLRLMRGLTRLAPVQWLVWRAAPAIIGERATRGIVRRYRHSPLNRREATRAPVADDLRRRLQADFAPDVERLSGMLGRDMAALWWPERSRRVAA